MPNIGYTLVDASSNNNTVVLDDLLLRRDAFAYGKIYTFGIDPLAAGYLATGTAGVNYYGPTEIAGQGSWLKVSVGPTNMAAINTAGTLWTWGYNDKGQLGDGTTSNRSSPVTVLGGSTWSKVAINNSGSCYALRTDGTLYAWGDNFNGQLGNGTTLNASNPTAVTTNTIFSQSGAASVGLYWKDVSCGGSHALGINQYGNAYAWGNNQWGQLGDTTTSNRSTPVRVSIPSANVSGIQQISAGYGSSAAIDSNGTLWTWGRNSSGILGNNSTDDRSTPVSVVGGQYWKSVSLGSAITPTHAGGITTTGTLFMWGGNDLGQLGDGTTSNRSSPVTVMGGGTNWTQVSAGTKMSIGLTSEGALYVWGNNSWGDGMLGLGSENRFVSFFSSPTINSQVQTLWKQVQAGQGGILLQDSTV
jgi:alpha-tubulin suppressor-like RCC1 family protein